MSVCGEKSAAGSDGAGPEVFPGAGSSEGRKDLTVFAAYALIFSKGSGGEGTRRRSGFG